MGLIALDCTKCGARLEVDDQMSTYTCKYCHTAHVLERAGGAAPTPGSLAVMAARFIAAGEFGKAMQFAEQGLAIAPSNKHLLDLEAKARAGLASLATGESARTAGELKQIADHSEAEQYALQATFVLNALQANIQVYGSNSALTGATPADVDLGLQYINRSLELFPDNAVYLNTAALLYWEGKKDKERGLRLMKKAAARSPRDINIQNNLKTLTASNASSCFIATAAFGTPLASEVDVLRAWRDRRLLASTWGKCFVAIYYFISPPIAGLIATRPTLRYATRRLLAPLVKRVSVSYSADCATTGDQSE